MRFRSESHLPDDSQRTAELLEQLLTDADFRAQFRRDPAGVCREFELPELADDLSASGGKALHTLEIRESRSSLAGALIAAAGEGMGVVDSLRRLHEQGSMHADAAHVVERALASPTLQPATPEQPVPGGESTAAVGGNAGADPHAVEYEPPPVTPHAGDVPPAAGHDSVSLPAAGTQPGPASSSAAAAAAADHPPVVPSSASAPLVDVVQLGSAPADVLRAHVALAVAEKYLGTPYHWDGDTPATGFDCSGLVEYAYHQVGVSLPHFAASQFDMGIHVSRADLQPGDLVFFQDSTGYIHHVGMSLGGDRFIQAPQTGDVVKISSLNEPYFAQQFAGGRRMAQLADPSTPIPAGLVPRFVHDATPPVRALTGLLPGVAPPPPPHQPQMTGFMKAVDPSQQQSPGSSAAASHAIDQSINLSPSGAGVQDLSFPANSTGLADQIDQYLSRRGSPMANLGPLFVAAGQAHNIDPRLLVAISGIETSFGTASGAGTDVTLGHNAWGWGPHEQFPDWQTAIDTVAKTLRKDYLDAGLTTVDQIVHRYAPASDGNDEARWASVVNGFLGELRSGTG